jgi:hypothetical protein
LAAVRETDKVRERARPLAGCLGRAKRVVEIR